MSDGKRKFEEDLAIVLRRVRRLRAAIDGQADVRYVQVKACKVRAHERGAHRRAVIVLRSKS